MDENNQKTLQALFQNRIEKGVKNELQKSGLLNSAPERKIA